MAVSQFTLTIADALQLVPAWPLTFCMVSCNPGASRMQESTVTASSISAYIMRELVEFAHDGHAEQHRLQAAEPQQQAN